MPIHQCLVVLGRQYAPIFEMTNKNGTGNQGVRVPNVTASQTEFHEFGSNSLEVLHESPVRSPVGGLKPLRFEEQPRLYVLSCTEFQLILYIRHGTHNFNRLWRIPGCTMHFWGFIEAVHTKFGWQLDEQQRRLG